MRFFLLISLFVSFSSFSNEPIKQSTLLEKIEKGRVKYESELIYWFYEGYKEETLAEMSANQKLVYPKFDTDLLRIRYTYDAEYRYLIYFDFTRQKCMHGVQKRSQHRMILMCREAIKECLKEGKNTMADFDESLKCYNKSTYCKAQRPMERLGEIDKRYCEIIYGRKL